MSRALKEMGFRVEEAKVCSVSSYCVDLVVRQAVPTSTADGVAASEDGVNSGPGGGKDEECRAGSRGWLLLFEEEGERYFQPSGCHWAKGATIVRRRHLERLFDAGGYACSVVVVPSWEWHQQLARPGARSTYLRGKLS